ncbi:LacI family DNA-binding transcriptional regulator [Azohydromonas caseinilytica]|uniref:LacI family DNA-binding transcriptional regulator n=1 Tax=Azohydromonas caseinilytica TaxID=2728836 RepID=A0A848F7Q5_9BURK|nr:LacI family DNA-binding transcriptional regulator [Azohydromonas caseinilytica]NML15604.1 LacI family DNA-binding transcriptional regulator [Azohydromonas caseinilytica]
MSTPPTSTTRPRLTIDDVAREAGVSKATVSRVLNGRGALMSPELAARVREAIDRLGYAPSPMAQALKRGRSRLIGLVVADVANPFSVAVLQGAEKACREAGYMLMLFNLGGDEAREREAIAALASYQVEGFILHTLGRDRQVLHDALERGKPIVLVDRALDAPLDLVGLDNAQAVPLALDHLLQQGWNDLLFVTEPMQGASSREERHAAFNAFVQTHAGQCRGRTAECAVHDDAALDQALRALRAEAGTRRPAVLAVNAPVGLRVAAAARRLGLTLGLELGLVSFDETDWAPLVGPGITTLAQPTDEIGRQAARCLVERLEGQPGEPRRFRLPARLVVRGSSQPG